MKQKLDSGVSVGQRNPQFTKTTGLTKTGPIDGITDIIVLRVAPTAVFSCYTLSSTKTSPRFWMAHFSLAIADTC